MSFFFPLLLLLFLLLGGMAPGAEDDVGEPVMESTL